MIYPSLKVVHEGAKVPATCSLCQLTFENHSKMVKHKRKEHWDAGKDREDVNQCCRYFSAPSTSLPKILARRGIRSAWSHTYSS